jgi:hypothetical protein
MKAYTPEVASGATSSAVKVPQVASVKNSSLMGSTPLQTYHSGMQPSGAPHVGQGPAAFSSPAKMPAQGAMTRETRNPSNGVPHISMHP